MTIWLLNASLSIWEEVGPHKTQTNGIWVLALTHICGFKSWLCRGLVQLPHLQKEDDGNVPASLAWGEDWGRTNLLGAWLRRKHSVLGTRVIAGHHISGYTWHLVSFVLSVVVSPLKLEDSPWALMLWHAGSQGSVWPGTRVQGKTWLSSADSLFLPEAQATPSPLCLLL